MAILLALWCGQDNLELNMLKTAKMTVDFRRSSPALSMLTLLDRTVPSVETFRCPRTTISQDLKGVSNSPNCQKKAAEDVLPAPA